MIEIKRKSSTPTEAQEGAKQRDELPGGVPPPGLPTTRNNPITGPTRGIQGTGSPPDMMEVWRECFRIYSRYAPAIRAAAAREDGHVEAGEIFLEALERVKVMARAGEDGEIIGFGVFNMLDEVWQRARKS